MPAFSRAGALVSFLERQRWFGGKARVIADVDVVDDGALGPNAVLAVVAVRFADGGAERYFVPLADARDGDVIVDAIFDDETCRALVDVLANGATLTLARGRVQATSGTSSIAAAVAPRDLPVRRTAPDQSNTSIIFGDDLILKVFRRLEPGLNPDVEIGRFLTAHGFTRVPGLVADADYVAGQDAGSSVLMLQQFVPNQGNAWQAMLDEGGPASIALAETLGRRTGELHDTLASDPDDPAFAPEAYSRADVDALAAGMHDFGARQLQLLRGASLPADARAAAARLLARQDDLLARFEALHDVSRPGLRIRCHGDYHLGQTLVADGDVFILDFEGEPARSLAERRAKSSALRDVAGMLRSFSYAAEVSKRGAAWEHAVASAFLDGYRAAVGRAEFLPPQGADFDVVLNAFLLDKALYELGYELNNRPDWVNVPLAALARLAGVDAAAPTRP